VIRFEYDENDRLLRKILPTETVEYRYDAMGNLISAADGDSAINNTFDPANRLTQIVTNGTSQASSDLSQGFAGYRRSSLSATAGGILETVDFGYDGLYRTNRISGSSLPGSHDLNYDGLGRRAQLTYPNGDLLSYRYDDASRLLGLSGSGFPGTLEYSYDDVPARPEYSAPNRS
jgi:YD repeat-containing protein